MLGKEETNMRTAPLGKTGLTVTRTALGCLPLQRRTTQEAVELIRAAYQEGITLYDTARSYTDSEEKIAKRLLRAKVEFQAAHDYDYFVINDTVEGAVQELNAILTAEHCRPTERMEIING